MKLMITLNIQKFVSEYNKYGVLYGAEAMTEETVYDMLEKIFILDIYREVKCTYVLFTAEELEKFAGMFIDDIWEEIALDKSTKISFFY